jgi:hypothetical protein
MIYKFKLEDSMWLGRRGKAFFGSIDFNGAAYITGGVAINGASMGCPTRVVSVRAVSGLNGYVWEFDAANTKLLAYEGGEVTASANATMGPATITVLDGGADADGNAAIYVDANGALAHNLAEVNSVTGVSIVDPSITVSIAQAPQLSEIANATSLGNEIFLEVIGY